MKIPDYIKHKHARDEGGKPYPCAYCIHYPGYAKNCKYPANLVVTFAEKGKEKNEDGYIEDICNLNRVGPDDPERGECQGYSPIVIDFRTHCIPDVFQFLESDYMMYVICRIYEVPGIQRSEVINRSEKGYQTRTARIEELVEEGFVEVMLDIHNEEVLYCTAMGDELAKIIRTLYTDLVILIQEGDALDTNDVKALFKYIFENKGCTRPQIYRYMMDEYDIEDYLSFHIMERLLDSKYIEGTFNPDNWNEINYNITLRGLRQWNKQF